MTETETRADPARDWWRWAGPGVLLVFPIHGMTDDWVLSSATALGVVSLLAGAYFLIDALRRNAQRSTGPKKLRRVGWGTRIGVVLAVLAIIGVTSAELDSHTAHSDRLAAGIALPLLVGYVALALTGAITRTSRSLWRSLPANRTTRNTVLGLAGAALFMLFMSLAGYISVGGMRAHGVVTSGSVVDVTTWRNTDTYFLRYTLPSGRVVRCSTEDVSGTYHPGDQIQVRYDSSDPSTGCQSADYSLSYATPNLFLGVSAVGLACAAVMWTVARQRANCGAARADGANAASGGS